MRLEGGPKADTTVYDMSTKKFRGLISFLGKLMEYFVRSGFSKGFSLVHCHAVSGSSQKHFFLENDLFSSRLHNVTTCHGIMAG